MLLANTLVLSLSFAPPVFKLRTNFGKSDEVTSTRIRCPLSKRVLVVIGVGVRPEVSLADGAGLAVDHGVLVDEYLQTSVADVFAAGDIARWPDPRSKERIRVEHWVVAERQGQTAARNMLGKREKFDAVPFFWSQHYDVGINYVGHATAWDRIEIDGKLDEHNAAVRFIAGEKTIALATIFRDGESLGFERQLELRGASAT